MTLTVCEYENIDLLLMLPTPPVKNWFKHMWQNMSQILDILRYVEKNMVYEDLLKADVRSQGLPEIIFFQHDCVHRLCTLGLTQWQFM